MRSLNINLNDLADAMDQADRDINQWYLDTQLGEVVLVGADFTDMDENEEDDDNAPPCQKKERELKYYDDTTADNSRSRVTQAARRQQALHDQLIGAVRRHRQKRTADQAGEDGVRSIETSVPVNRAQLVRR